jgi:hypothetical protein
MINPWQVFAELVVVPVIYVGATPFILISAPFRKSGMKGGYAAVRRWLDELRTY